MFWPRSKVTCGFLAGAVGSIWMKGLGRVATQTLVFLFAGIGLPAAMVQRAKAGYRRQAGHGR